VRRFEPLALIEAWPVRHCVAGAVFGGGPARTVGDVDRPYEWASVTKLLTSLAILLAAEEGILTLEEPAGPPSSSVRHLLAHASGLGLRGCEPLVAPGTRRIYSNRGYELLGELLGERSGMGFGHYVEEGILRPLAMAGTTVAGSPAAGARGGLADLLRLGGELARPSRIVSAETAKEAHRVAFPGLSGVLPGFGLQEPCDWGLGPEIRAAKSPHWAGQASPAAFGHFGQSGSFLLIDPPAGAVIAALCDRPFGDWAKTAWPELIDAVLAAGP